MSNLREVGDGSPSRVVLAAFLTKLAKHLVLLACLAIVAQAGHRALVRPLSIFLIIVGAAFVHTVGAALKTRRGHR